jgi:dienelactone hydrolase
VSIRLAALPPGGQVAITATVRAGALWTSKAVYAVPAGGVVDLDRQAPLDGPFRGADGMGLFWSLRSASGAPATSDETWGADWQTVRLTAVIDGRRVAATDILRVGLTGSASSRSVFTSGISAEYFDPAPTSEGLRPAVLVFDDTDSGISTGVLTASRLAAVGYPALNLSTYGSAGQSGVSRSLPAERFLAALHWLSAQPGVDPRRIFTFGASRGAQLALWAAVSYPDLVYGAIAPAGTTGLVCSSPIPSPAVTVGGDWVPCLSGTHLVNSAAVLDLSRITGPVVLGCAGQDEQLDNACEWMAAGRTARGERVDDAFISAPDATHTFYLPPYWPLDLPAAPYAQPTEDARVALWKAIAAALAAPSSVPGR